MPSKNDITSLKVKSKDILGKSQARRDEPIKSKKKGPEPKPKAERESFSIMLRLTEAEGRALQEKAGMVPLATFLKTYLRAETKLLK